VNENFLRVTNALASLSNTVANLGTNSGGSQTPWTSDIDGSGFSLTNARIFVGSPAYDSNSIWGNIPTDADVLATQTPVQSYSMLGAGGVFASDSGVAQVGCRSRLFR
jgi:hypothetical protein